MIEHGLVSRVMVLASPNSTLPTKNPLSKLRDKRFKKLEIALVSEKILENSKQI